MLEAIKGYAFGIGFVLAMFSFFAAVTAVHVGLLLGVLLSLLSCFVRSLRRAVPYLLLMPLCAAASGWSLFAGFFRFADSSHLDMEQLFRASMFVPWAGFTFGGLLGTGLGFLLAKSLNRLLQRPTLQS